MLIGSGVLFAQLVRCCVFVCVCVCVNVFGVFFGLAWFVSCFVLVVGVCGLFELCFGVCSLAFLFVLFCLLAYCSCWCFFPAWMFSLFLLVDLLVGAGGVCFVYIVLFVVGDAAVVRVGVCVCLCLVRWFVFDACVLFSCWLFCLFLFGLLIDSGDAFV